MSPRFAKPPPELVELFDELVSELPATRRTMFGCPCGFRNGHMFCGLFEQRLFVRLSEADRALLLAQEGAEPFDPMGGRPMREYVVVPHGMLDEPRELASWLSRALRFAESLPARAAKRPRKAKRPNSTKPKRR